MKPLARCKKCSARYYSRYVQRNSERIAIRRRAYYLRNKDKILRRDREYKLKNRQQVLARCRKYYKLHFKTIAAKMHVGRRWQTARYKKWLKGYTEKNRDVLRSKAKEYVRRHYSKFKKRWKEYYWKNRSKRLLGCRRWNLVNKDYLRQYRKAHYFANKEKIRLYSQKWYRKNRKNIIAKCMEWARRNRLRVNIKNAKRRAAMRKVASEKILPSVLLARYKEFNFRCAYCGRRSKLQPDHVKPISGGGGHLIRNIVPACPRCNPSKKARRDWEVWFRSCSFYSRERERRIKEATA